MRKRVVITGMGPATAVGIGKETFFNSIIGMKTNLSEIPPCYEKNYRFKSRYFVPKPIFSLADYGVHASLENVMEDTAKLSVLCTKLALEDAGFRVESKEKSFHTDIPENCSITIGIGMSSLQTALESYTAHTAPIDEEDTDKRAASPRYHRMVIPMLMPNAASAWVSILFGIQGFNYTINASCASGSFAIGEAYRNILGGRCDIAIAGGVEALTDKSGAIMRGFDMLTTLTKSPDGGPLPFSHKRSGFLFNEGAGCMLILEELQSAKKRGARIYAEIIGYECSSDAYNIVQMDPSGENILKLYNKISNGYKIDYINAHGTGTVLNDDIEAKIIQTIFGDKESQPYINSTKGIIGHSIGASGAIEAAVTAMSIKHSVIHGNLTEYPLDNLNLPLSSFNKDINYALSASYGFGGHNALLLFKKVDEHE
ncbi:beta-ketoacyl-[acyl-carrier-protein] synthase family protein [Petroclostridium sp. X23]|uniref:beta-ketoacyl-[acyl-carrier-protein] synthase family protein n=1 Tax=Petroclostridium sp. X23 TaxID=3045146 RepID=UPI0024AE6B79|nr:beta-ketoacyl-[acyl-carrier-protein] synthase family protein [Petroclostridium sp. X23]WHH59477.1 beta-ketoacyl-[acyl-carrier-protein] synthase family protein [Petroclostridium sp. X23]